MDHGYGVRTGSCAVWLVNAGTINVTDGNIRWIVVISLSGVGRRRTVTGGWLWGWRFVSFRWAASMRRRRLVPDMSGMVDRRPWTRFLGLAVS
jgi:hypothetical protein